MATFMALVWRIVGGRGRGHFGFAAMAGAIFHISFMLPATEVAHYLLVFLDSRGAGFGCGQPAWGLG
jgi:hypothetical protein